MNLQNEVRSNDVPAIDASSRHAADMHGVDGRVQFISFAIDEDQYGVDIMSVREIKGWSEVNWLPNQPDYMRGVVNLRGIVIPIIDLRCRFSQGLTEATALHIVIIVQVGSRHVGLLADRVLDIVSVSAADIQPVPSIGQAAHAAFLSGLVSVDGGHLIALVDLPHLLGAQLDVEQSQRSGAEPAPSRQSSAS